MSDISIRLATQNDTGKILSMLSQLADEIGSKKHFFSTSQAIDKYGFGEMPMFHCFIAEGEKPAMGLALFFPVFSTNRGKPGIYLQDLWISQDARGQGLGQRMMAQVVKHGKIRWHASYLTLSVYSDNHKATSFYQNLGFVRNQREVPLALDGEAFEQMGGSI